jgi:hypothetical protein
MDDDLFAAVRIPSSVQTPSRGFHSQNRLSVVPLEARLSLDGQLALIRPNAGGRNPIHGLHSAGDTDAVFGPFCASPWAITFEVYSVIAGIEGGVLAAVIHGC